MMKTLLTLILTGLLSFACWAADTVNVNTASAEEIAEGLKGIGLAKAEAIISYRETNGAFMHIDELVNVKGIGIRTVDLNRGVIKLEGETVLATSKE
jgi:competence protein ComEA